MSYFEKLMVFPPENAVKNHYNNPFKCGIFCGLENIFKLFLVTVYAYYKSIYSRFNCKYIYVSARLIMYIYLINYAVYINYKLSIVHCPLSIVNCPLSISPRSSLSQLIIYMQYSLYISITVIICPHGIPSCLPIIYVSTRQTVIEKVI